MNRIALILFSFLTLVRADTLILRNGSSVSGGWLGADGQMVKFLVNDQVQTFPRSEVQQVIFGSSAPAQAPIGRVPPPPSSPFVQVSQGVRIQLDKCERRDTSAVMAMSPPDAPMTSTLRPASGPPM